MVQGEEGEAGWARGSSPQPHTCPVRLCPTPRPRPVSFKINQRSSKPAAFLSSVSHPGQLLGSNY